MINLLAEKFIADKEKIRKLKEVLNMTAVMQMVWDEASEKARKETIQERDIDHAKNALREGLPIDVVKRITGLTTKQIKELQAELNNN
jgi:hypothetical protein